MQVRILPVPLIFERKVKIKTQKEINTQIAALKEVRPKIKPYSFFGDDNLAKLDAQVRVLEEDLDEDDIWEEWPEDEEFDIRTAADNTVAWRNGDSDVENLADDWPVDN